MTLSGIEYPSGPARIEDESGLSEMDRAGEFAAQVRLALDNRLVVENFAFNPVLPCPLEIPHSVGKRCIPPIHFDPAAPPQQLRHPGFGDQRLVLDQAAADQRHDRHRSAIRPVRCRRQEVAHQPWQERRQIGELVAHLRRAVESVSEDLSEIAGKHVREDRGAFDHSGIAIAGPFAGNLVPIDQDHVPSPLLQVQGGADADHACTQYENVGLEFRHWRSES